MTQTRRRGRADFSPSPAKVAAIKKFNENIRYVQGFTTTLGSSGAVNLSIALNAAGRKLLGISIIPTSGVNADLCNSQVNFVVNNNNILLNVGTANLIPNYVQSMIFFATPQPLSGNDIITLQITNNAATTPGAIVNIFYEPQI